MTDLLGAFLEEHDRRLRAAVGAQAPASPLSTYPFATLSGQIAGPLAWVQFANTIFAEADLARIELWNSRFQIHCYDSVFVKAPMYESEISSSSFYRCNFARTDLSNARIEGSLFVDCDLRFAHLSKAKLTNVHFVRCVFDRTFFDGAEITGVSIVDPIIEGRCFLDGLAGPGARLMNDVLDEAPV